MKTTCEFCLDEIELDESNTHYVIYHKDDPMDNTRFDRPNIADLLDRG